MTTEGRVVTITGSNNDTNLILDSANSNLHDGIPGPAGPAGPPGIQGPPGVDADISLVTAAQLTADTALVDASNALAVGTAAQTQADLGVTNSNAAQEDATKSINDVNGLAMFLISHPAIANGSEATTDSSFVYTTAGVTRLNALDSTLNLTNVNDGSSVTVFQKKVLDAAGTVIDASHNRYIGQLNDENISLVENFSWSVGNSLTKEGLLPFGNNLKVYNPSNLIGLAVSLHGGVKVNQNALQIINEYKKVIDTSSTYFSSNPLDIILGNSGAEDYGLMGYNRNPPPGYDTSGGIIVNNVLDQNSKTIINGLSSSSVKSKVNYFVNNDPSFNVPWFVWNGDAVDSPDFSSNGLVFGLTPSALVNSEHLAKYLIDNSNHHIVIATQTHDNSGGDPNTLEDANPFVPVYMYNSFVNEFRRLALAANLVENSTFSITDISFTGYIDPSYTTYINNKITEISNNLFDTSNTCLVVLATGYNKIKYAQDEDGNDTDVVIKQYTTIQSAIANDLSSQIINNNILLCVGAPGEDYQKEFFEDFSGAIYITNSVDPSLNERAEQFALDVSNTYNIDISAGAFSDYDSSRRNRNTIDAVAQSILSIQLARYNNDIENIKDYIVPIINGTGDMSGGTVFGPNISDLVTASNYISDGSGVIWKGVSINEYVQTASGYNGVTGPAKLYVSTGSGYDSGTLLN